MVKDEIVRALARGESTTSELVRATGRHERTVIFARDGLVASGVVIAVGSGRGARYRLAHPDAHQDVIRKNILMHPDVLSEVHQDVLGERGNDGQSVCKSLSSSEKQLETTTTDRRTDEYDIRMSPKHQDEHQEKHPDAHQDAFRKHQDVYGSPSGCRRCIDLERELVELHELLARTRRLLGPRDEPGVAHEVLGHEIAAEDPEFAKLVDLAYEESEKAGLKVRKTAEAVKRGIARNLRREPDQLQLLRHRLMDREARVAEAKARAEELKAEGRKPIALGSLTNKIFGSVPKGEDEVGT